MVTNVILIDSSLLDYQVFVNSVNASTIPILYSKTTTRAEILSQLSTYTSIDRIAIAFSNDGFNLFLENQTFFDNMNFIIQLIQQYSVKHIDYLACNTLNFSAWVQYYNTIADQTGVIVGASNNTTGNIQYGGDWSLESTGEDIEDIYFTQSIDYYKYLLDSGSSHTIVLKNDNFIYGTGNNLNGSLGLNDNTNKSTLQKITTPKTPVSFSKGFNFTIVLMSDGTIYGTGLNDYGQLGLGDNSERITLQPITIPNSKLASAVFCGFAHTLVITTDGQLYGTGRNVEGQLGISYGNRNTLQQITCPKTPFSCACGGIHSIVLMSDGTIMVQDAILKDN